MKHKKVFLQKYYTVILLSILSFALCHAEPLVLPEPPVFKTPETSATATIPMPQKSSLIDNFADTDDELGQDETDTAILETAVEPESTEDVQEEVETIEEKAAELTQAELPIEKELADTAKSPIYLGEFLHPWEFGDPDELIEFEFENAEISNLITYIEKRYGLTFILDDQIKPLPQGGKSVLGTKISFRTHQPLSKKNAWDIFITFLDMAGLATQPGPAQGIYRITTNDPKSPLSITKGPMPTFIGVDPSLIPDNDTRIRYVYFVENTSLDVIKSVVDTMKSVTSPNLLVFPELRAIIMTDKATNIKAILEIVRELDKVNMPETLSILKLRRTDATKVAELYKTLIKDESQATLQMRLLGGRKQPTTSYFSEGTRVIPEPRTNSLILLGTRDAIKRIEDFIIKEIDKELDIPFSPLHVYRLKFVEAEAVANILKEVVQFQTESEAAKYGGVRDGDKYFKPLSITPEKSGNQLIINADYEDYLKIFELLQKIDVEQPQVAIKVFIINIDVSENKAFGIQMRNKIQGPNGLLGENVNFQTSGLAGTGSPVIENTAGTGATRLLGDLVKLALSAQSGATYLTLGNDAFGVWGMLRMLETYNKLSILANPFLVTTHKYPAVVSLGETRRVITGTAITPTGPINSNDDLSANLEVHVEPQISYEGLITLDVRIISSQFTSSDQNSGNRTIKEIKTSVLMADNETLALGGLIRDKFQEGVSKVPILGDIPVLGWLFKNKTKALEKTSLLILITPEIIPAHTNKTADNFTKEKAKDATDMIKSTERLSDHRDPVHRWFFKDHLDHEDRLIDSFVEIQDRYVDPALRPTAGEIPTVPRDRVRMPATKDGTTTIVPKKKKRLTELIDTPKTGVKNPC